MHNTALESGAKDLLCGKAQQLPPEPEGASHFNTHLSIFLPT